jgi:hypothetical protein
LAARRPIWASLDHCFRNFFVRQNAVREGVGGLALA